MALIARPGAGRTIPPAGALAGTASSAPSQAGATIQVRDFPSSSIVEVVAWSASEPRLGLRTWVRRNGAADRYHRFWVSSAYPAIGDASKAQAFNRPLQVGSARDEQNCVNGKCAPASTVTARLPDGPFRESKEDLAVKFITASGNDITLTLRRGLIDAYLGTVDSVMAALKK